MALHSDRSTSAVDNLCELGIADQFYGYVRFRIWHDFLQAQVGAMLGIFQANHEYIIIVFEEPIFDLKFFAAIVWHA